MFPVWNMPLPRYRPPRQSRLGAWRGKRGPSARPVGSWVWAGGSSRHLAEAESPCLVFSSVPPEQAAVGAPVQLPPPGRAVGTLCPGGARGSQSQSGRPRPLPRTPHRPRRLRGSFPPIGAQGWPGPRDGRLSLGAPGLCGVECGPVCSFSGSFHCVFRTGWRVYGTLQSTDGELIAPTPGTPRLHSAPETFPAVQGPAGTTMRPSGCLSRRPVRGPAAVTPRGERDARPVLDSEGHRSPRACVPTAVPSGKAGWGLCGLRCSCSRNSGLRVAGSASPGASSRDPQSPRPAPRSAPPAPELGRCGHSPSGPLWAPVSSASRWAGGARVPPPLCGHANRRVSGLRTVSGAWGFLGQREFLRRNSLCSPVVLTVGGETTHRQNPCEEGQHTRATPSSCRSASHVSSVLCSCSTGRVSIPYFWGNESVLFCTFPAVLLTRALTPPSLLFRDIGWLLWPVLCPLSHTAAPGLLGTGGPCV